MVQIVNDRGGKAPAGDARLAGEPPENLAVARSLSEKQRNRFNVIAAKVERGRR